MEPENGFRWRYRGQTLDPASFAESLHNGTYAQYLVAGKSDRHIYGLVVAYAANPGLGHCYIGFQRSSQRRPQGEMLEGMFLFLRYLFDSNPLRKIYAELPDYNEQIIGLVVWTRKIRLVRRRRPLQGPRLSCWPVPRPPRVRVHPPSMG